MAGNGRHVAAMVRSHAAGDDANFYSVALQVAAREAKAGHHVLANDIKKAVDASREQKTVREITMLAQPRGELADLVQATYPDVRLRELVAPTDLVSQIKRVLAEQRQRSNLLEHGFTPAHRLLLEGPPGTGKTMTAAVLATELAVPMFTVRLDSLLSKFMGETASKLRLVFDAVAGRRGVYLFDEFDALGADRSGNDVGEARRILNSFLMFLEETSSESLVCAATNHRSILDRALFRRFDAVLTYSLPDARQATIVMKARLGTLARNTSMAGLGQYTSGLSHAELVKAAESAAKAVLMRGEKQVDRDDLIIALSSRRQASFD
ncbi:AAA family ATPase [Corynebacterium choanae]|uniref:ATP-dependent zinc metalloprotease FtsH n=1 Tax=Corynebacterium choanae TaxID=1862358 RepID=A0A3G6J8G6_9CORY|nr:ATP-binding protein [Corynebacterium choanae]AZA14357.1 ATP-dependent zinc metalloprotease FtsH [Corynebacterium choanae]